MQPATSTGTNSCPSRSQLMELGWSTASESFLQDQWTSPPEIPNPLLPGPAAVLGHPRNHQTIAQLLCSNTRRLKQPLYPPATQPPLILAGTTRRNLILLHTTPTHFSLLFFSLFVSKRTIQAELPPHKRWYQWSSLADINNLMEEF